MAYYKISGFADEIAESVDTQFEVLNKLNMGYFEPRGIDGKNISRLTDEEWEVMKQHPTIGAEKVLMPNESLHDLIPIVKIPPRALGRFRIS